MCILFCCFSIIKMAQPCSFPANIQVKWHLAYERVMFCFLRSRSLHDLTSEFKTMLFKNKSEKHLPKYEFIHIECSVMHSTRRECASRNHRTRALWASCRNVAMILIGPAGSWMYDVCMYKYLQKTLDCLYCIAVH